MTPMQDSDSSAHAAQGKVSTADSRKTIVLTGATGFLGSHLLFHLARRQKSRVHALVRADGPTEAAVRIDSALAACAASYCIPQLAPVNWQAHVGDITQALCGLSELDISRIAEDAARGSLEVWHLAASLNFEERRRTQIFAQNLAGTRNVVQLAQRLGAQRVVYVSTAYSAGIVSGRVEEVLHPLTRDFNNVYEESKCAAEHAVSLLCEELLIDWRILRPSIVVGPMATLKSGGSDSGIYGFYRELHRVRELLRGVEQPLSIAGDPDLCLNLVPVDHVVEDMLYLIDHDFAGGRIFHLTAEDPPRADLALAEACRVAGVPRVRLALRQRPPTALESVMEARTRFYGSYLRDAKIFVRSLPKRKSIGLEHVAGYLAEYANELEHKDRDSMFRRSVCAAADGTPLCTFAAGDPAFEPLLLVNAYGMPADIWGPLCGALSEKYHVVTWETRGLPNVAAPYSATEAPIDDHAADMACVLDHYGMHAAHVIAWCSGAQIALRFSALHRQRVHHLVLLNGFFRLPEEVPLTEFHRDLYAILPTCARTVADAQRYCDLIFGSGSSVGRADKRRVSALLGEVDPALMHMTSAPFRSGAALHRFARMLMAFREPAPSDWCPAQPAPTLLISGAKDTIAHPAGSVAMAAQLPGAELVILDDGDHFMLYHDADIPRRIETFFANGRKRSTSCTPREQTLP